MGGEGNIQHLTGILIDSGLEWRGMDRDGGGDEEGDML